MKITIVENQDTELIIHCSSRSQPEIQKLLETLDELDRRIPIQQPGNLTMLCPEDVLYGEFVNRMVFIYTAKDVYPTGLTLSQLEESHRRFFRCSKSGVVNVEQISHLKSELNGRILATLSNGEQILISRHYASGLRRLLKQL